MALDPKFWMAAAALAELADGDEAQAQALVEQAQETGALEFDTDYERGEFRKTVLQASQSPEMLASLYSRFDGPEEAQQWDNATGGKFGDFLKNIFKKKEGGTNVGNALRSVVGGLTGRNQGTPAQPVAPVTPPQPPAPVAEPEFWGLPVKTWKTIAIGVGIALGVGIVVIVIIKATSDGK